MQLLTWLSLCAILTVSLAKAATFVTEPKAQKLLVHRTSAFLYATVTVNITEVGSHAILLPNLFSETSGNRSVEERSVDILSENEDLMIARVTHGVEKLSNDPEGDAAEKEKIHKLLEELRLKENRVAAALRRVSQVRADLTRLMEKYVATPSNDILLTLLGATPRAVAAGSGERPNDGSTHPEGAWDRPSTLANPFRLVTQDYQNELQQLELLTQQYEEEAQANDAAGKMLQKRLRELDRTAFCTKIVVSCLSTGLKTLSLNLLIGKAEWEPVYTLRLNTSSSSTPLSSTGAKDEGKSSADAAGAAGETPRTFMKVEYSALVKVESSVPLRNISLELSTEQPSLGRVMPLLYPWRITPTPTSAQSASNRRQQTQSAGTNGGAGRRAGTTSGASDAEYVKLKPDVDSQREAVASTQVVASGSHTNFALPGRFSLDSSVGNRVAITSLVVPVEIKYHCVPKLSSRVFVKARLINDSPFPLLSGKSLLYTDGIFVSTGALPAVPVGSSTIFDAGLDHRVTASRRLVHANTALNGWVVPRSRRDIFYHLIFVNKGSTPVHVEIQDQIPSLYPSQLFHTDDFMVNVQQPPFGDLPATIPDQEPLTLRGRSAQCPQQSGKPTPNGNAETKSAEGKTGDDGYRLVADDCSALIRSSGIVEWSLSIPAGAPTIVPLQYSINTPASYFLDNVDDL